MNFHNALKAQKQIRKIFLLNYISSYIIRSGADFSGVVLIVQVNVFYNCLLESSRCLSSLLDDLERNLENK